MELPARDKYWSKVRLAFPTFFLILIGSVLGLTLIRWVVSTGLEIDLKEQLWNMWIPMFLPCIPIVIWLRPQLKKLAENKDVVTVQVRLLFLAWIIIAVPLVFSQFYFSSASGTLTSLGTVDELPGQSPSSYYTIRDFQVLASSGGYSETIEGTGRSTEYLDNDVYFAAPIARTLTDSTNTNNCWYGIHHHLQISNRLNPAEKEQKYHTFYNECVSKIDNYNYHDVKFFRRLPNSDEKDGFLSAIERIDPSLVSSAVILEPMREEFEDRNGSTLAWLLGTVIAGSLVFLIALRWQM